LTPRVSHGSPTLDMIGAMHTPSRRASPGKPTCLTPIQTRPCAQAVSTGQFSSGLSHASPFAAIRLGAGIGPDIPPGAVAPSPATRAPAGEETWVGGAAQLAATSAATGKDRRILEEDTRPRSPPLLGSPAACESYPASRWSPRIQKVFSVMGAAAQHQFQMLT
jgi:hypothetical protein